jgi:hypothetical protein
MAIPSRRDIIRACKTRGWTLQPAVLAEIAAHLSESPEGSLDDLLNAVRGEMTTGKSVTVDVWNQVKAAAGGAGGGDFGAAKDHDIDEDMPTGTLNRKQNPSESHRHWEPSTSTSASTSTTILTGTNDWHVVNAFQTPRLVYQTMRKQFLVEEKSWSLLGTPEDKVRASPTKFICMVSTAGICS